MVSLIGQALKLGLPHYPALPLSLDVARPPLRPQQPNRERLAAAAQAHGRRWHRNQVPRAASAA
jgi:hypothetical protein